MNRRHLPENFVDDPEALIRKTRVKLKKTSSTLQHKASSNPEDRRSFIQNLSSEFKAMVNKSIREFSAPTMDNVRAGPTVEIDRNFELKPRLINMVQANQFCEKAHEDASAHLQHFMEICRIFTMSEVPRDAILLCLFPFSLLGRAKQWFYATKEKNTTWALCSTNFLAKFFTMGKTNALSGNITSFQQQHDESVPDAWERFQDYILECPHHGLESWLLMQTFYHGLGNSARESVDAAAGGAFLSLTIPQATTLVEKMASNQGWNEERTQTRKKGGSMHQLKEVDMLSAKLDLLMKKLDDKARDKKDVMHVYDPHMTCEECGDTGHTGNHCPEVHKDVNYINNNNYYYYNRPQQNQGWNQHRPNYSGNYQGNNSYNNNNNFPPLRELVSNQGKLMDNLSKKLAPNDKMLENINNRMNNFSTAIKNQISFNKMIESQLNQIAAVVSTTNPGIPSQREGLESANLVDLFDASNY